MKTCIALLAVMLAACSAPDKPPTQTGVFLYFCVTGAAPGTPTWRCTRHRYADQAECRVAQTTIAVTPKEVPAGAEKFNQIVTYCAPDNQEASYNAGWRRE